MNYEEEARAMLVELFREWWMNDDDWAGVLSHCEWISPLSELAKDIQAGVENGHSVEQQKRLILALFKEKD